MSTFLLVFTAFVAFWPIPSRGQIDSSATLNPVSGTNSSGSGVAVVFATYTNATLSWTVSFNGLQGETTMAHIHCCTAAPGVGTANPATPLADLPGFPLGVQADNKNAVLNMSQASSFSSNFLSMNGNDPATAWFTLFNGIALGLAYFNIHTTTDPAGEIAGFFTASTDVQSPSPVTTSPSPEPSPSPVSPSESPSPESNSPMASDSQSPSPMPSSSFSSSPSPVASMSPMASMSTMPSPTPSPSPSPMPSASGMPEMSPDMMPSTEMTSPQMSPMMPPSPSPSGTLGAAPSRLALTAAVTLTSPSSWGWTSPEASQPSSRQFTAPLFIVGECRAEDASARTLGHGLFTSMTWTALSSPP
eukprot:TRINITY_DN5549_c0_g1_i1.p1 TRINITY_DN5549_c0_g1~~TRINITY_DN5549_c0_g1_i1.p1  ORF type:complete len:372 (-),score=26.25 TRINITY_DN5549_c0_g1_i1:253-1332(-)